MRRTSRRATCRSLVARLRHVCVAPGHTRARTLRAGDHRAAQLVWGAANPTRVHRGRYCAWPEQLRQSDTNNLTDPGGRQAELLPEVVQQHHPAAGQPVIPPHQVALALAKRGKALAGELAELFGDLLVGGVLAPASHVGLAA